MKATNEGLLILFAALSETAYDVEPGIDICRRRTYSEYGAIITGSILLEYIEMTEIPIQYKVAYDKCNGSQEFKHIECLP